MNIPEMLAEGCLSKIKPDPEAIRVMMTSAENGLQEAGRILSEDPAKCFACTYDAVFDSCRAYMLSQGYRTTAENDYRAVLRFCKLTLRDFHKGILDGFAAAEIKRNKATYSGLNSVNDTEAGGLLKAARIFINHIRDRLDNR